MYFLQNLFVVTYMHINVFHEMGKKISATLIFSVNLPEAMTYRLCFCCFKSCSPWSRETCSSSSLRNFCSSLASSFSLIDPSFLFYEVCYAFIINHKRWKVHQLRKYSCVKLQKWWWTCNAGCCVMILNWRVVYYIFFNLRNNLTLHFSVFL